MKNSCRMPSGIVLDLGQMIYALPVASGAPGEDGVRLVFGKAPDLRLVGEDARAFLFAAETHLMCLETKEQAEARVADWAAQTKAIDENLKRIRERMPSPPKASWWRRLWR